jgi:hypothetical protein
MSGERKRKPSSGTAGGGWERWFPRFGAAVQLCLGTLGFVWAMTHPQAPPALLFASVFTIFGAPSGAVALRILGDLAAAAGSGRASPGGRQ